MENAAKALEIAGGILIATLIISLFIYMFNELSISQATQNKNAEAEALQKFNAKYDAYNKNILYGADVISVINMALSNNVTETQRGQEEGIMFDSNDPHNINIKFKIINPIIPSVYKFENENDDEDINIGKDIKYDSASGNGPVDPDPPGKNYTMEADIPEVYYDLSYYANKGSATNSPTIRYKCDDPYDNPILRIMPSDGIVLRRNSREVTRLKTEYEEFIEKIFRCTNVEFCESTGRINSMTFEELEIKTEP